MDKRYFPTFDECPHESYPDMEFYASKSGLMFKPTKHWCLFAEIIEVEYFLRLRLRVKDRSGKMFPIAFYIEEDERRINFDRFQKGRTVAILYAEQHGFLDSTVGIRQESTSTIDVFDMPLDTLLSLCEEIRKQDCGKAGPRRCDACGTERSSLAMCARCQCSWYCNSACQKQGWQQGGHQKTCRRKKEIKKLASFDWSKFSKHVYFPF